MRSIMNTILYELGFFKFSVHLKWRLHFEFVTSKTHMPSESETQAEDSSTAFIWEAPTNLNIETMVWDLPIKVYPLNPLNACLGSFEVDKIVSLTLS